MVAQEQPDRPKGIRWGELQPQIEEASKEDGVGFSEEARNLVRLGLQRRARQRRGKGAA